VPVSSFRDRKDSPPLSEQQTVKLHLCRVMDAVIYELRLAAPAPFASTAGGGRRRGVKFGPRCSRSSREQGQPAPVSGSRWPMRSHCRHLQL